MAEAVLSFDENTIKDKKTLWSLYTRLYEGMRSAQSVDSPSIDSVPIGEDGEADADTIAAVEKKLAEYSEILMKNSAYLFASSVIDVISSGGSGGGTDGGLGYVIRAGDSMTGLLGALHGFESGYNGVKIFETKYDAQDNPYARVTGDFIVTKNVNINGKLTLASTGLWFGENQVLFYDNDTLKIANENIGIDGKISVDGSLRIGDIVIDEDGIIWGDYEFYHSGNSNKKDVDWTMNNANIYGDLSVYGDTSLGGMLDAHGGLNVSVADHKIIYTQTKDAIDTDGKTVTNAWLTLASDLRIISGHGIKLDEDYVLRVRNGANGVISLSAPDRVLNLGDSDGSKATKYIALQSAIKNYSGAYNIVTQFGDGNFPNSFSAGTGNASNTAIRTYYTSASDQGVELLQNVRFGSITGPKLWSDVDAALKGSIPYILVSGENQEYHDLGFTLSYEDTTSLFKDQSKEWSASLHFHTAGEFFTFDKPIESESFSIKSEQYKTRLLENALFLNDGAFIEGLTDGIRYAGNAYFDGSLSSQKFASGFAGYGWAVMHNLITGNYAATFDELTVRKKMRVYELEIQKTSATNGSLWVSDSCSGDEVIAIG